MKVKITASASYDGFVYIGPSGAEFDNAIRVCRRYAKSLLRGTGKRLPKHGTEEVVEIELIAK